MTNTIDKCFGFVRDFGFKGPFGYQNHNAFFKDFVKDDLVISIIFNGKYWVEFIKTVAIFPALATGEMKLFEIDQKQLQVFDLSVLDKRKRIFNSVEFIDFNDKILWYHSKLLKANSEILKGDLSKLQGKKGFFKLFRFKKIVS
jgi:hypothetical protein